MNKLTIEVKICYKMNTCINCVHSQPVLKSDGNPVLVCNSMKECDGKLLYVFYGVEDCLDEADCFVEKYDEEGNEL